MVFKKSKNIAALLLDSFVVALPLDMIVIITE